MYGITRSRSTRFFGKKNSIQILRYHNFFYLLNAFIYLFFLSGIFIQYAHNILCCGGHLQPSIIIKQKKFDIQLFFLTLAVILKKIQYGTITDYKDFDENAVIPSYINGEPVTSIGNCTSFSKDSPVISITIPYIDV